LKLAEGELVAVRRRVRSIDGIPYNTNDSHFPLALVQGSEIMNPDDIARGANVVLTELGHEQVRALDEIQLRMPTPEEADRLQLGPGTPVAVHICTGYTQDGTPVRTVINILPGDRHVITYERLKGLGRPLIRPASMDDLDTIISLWTHAASWLESRGIDQWQYPPKSERIAENISAGECWMVEEDGVAIATITVDDHADSDFWTPEEISEPALYVHRMVVRRDASNQGLGSAMLDWAGRRALKQGKNWLRLDAWKTNEGLHMYYQSQGFAHLRTIDLPTRGSGALFQRASVYASGLGPRLVGPEA
jgi:GNAT superfamily N-acetyltransferase